MLGELVEDGTMDIKKNIADSKAKKDPLCSPPCKKLKQARLPFKPLDAKSPTPSNKQCKKRKLSGSDKSMQSPKNAKLSTEATPSIVTEHKSINDRLAAFKYQGPADGENEVSSSSESEKLKSAGKAVDKQKGHKLTLDAFVQRPQQSQVSTSDGLETIELNDSDEDDSGRTSVKIQFVVDNDKEHASEHIDASIEAVISKARKSVDSISSQDGDSEMDVSQEKVSHDDSLVLIYSTESTDSEEDEKDVKDNLTSPKVMNHKNQVNSTPKNMIMSSKKTPLRAKSLQKSAEKDRIKEEKAKERLEQLRIKEQEKAEKQRLKEEIKRAKEKEREETRKQKQIEKEKKEQEKREKKEKEEQERLEKLKAKEEERRKKQELVDAKTEEKRKKEDDRKKQEDEKKKIEEEKIKKEQKVKNSFKSFFSKVESTPKPTQVKSLGPFMVFQQKKDMVLAPRCRTDSFHGDRMKEFDRHFAEQNSTIAYLHDIKSGKHKPGKSGRTLIQRKVQSEKTVSMETDDIQVIEELSSKPSEKKKVNEKVYRMKGKLFQFHENHRPAYWGSFGKKSNIVKPRKPLAKDEEILDYEVDSDDEWEEPGESLSHSEGEDDNNEGSDDSGDDDGFFVPHGYLSENEGCDEEADDLESFKVKRAAKATQWEAELRRQTQPKEPVIIGCIWAGEKTHEKLEKFKILSFVSVPVPTSFTMKTTGESIDFGSESLSRSTTSNKKPVPKEALPDLISLIHGNRSGIKVLIKEFREHWNKKVNAGDGEDTEVITKPDESNLKKDPMIETLSTPTRSRPGTPVESRPSTPLEQQFIDQSQDYIISKRQLDIKINAIAVREKRAGCKNVCWYVHQNILEEYKLTELPIPNQWNYVTKTPKHAIPVGDVFALNEETVKPVSGKAIPNIMQFAKPVSPSSLFEKAKIDEVTPKTNKNTILSAFQNQTCKVSLQSDPGYTADSESDDDDDDDDDCFMVDENDKSPAIDKSLSTSNVESPKGQLTLLSMLKSPTADLSRSANPDKSSVKSVSAVCPQNITVSTNSLSVQHVKNTQEITANSAESTTDISVRISRENKKKETEIGIID